MDKKEIKREMEIPEGSTMTEQEYRDFLVAAYEIMSEHPLYFAPEEDINSLELAQSLPFLKESLIAIYVAINDAVCNKALVTPFLLRHGHNSVFVFDPQVYPGGSDVPSGTSDARDVINGFEPPNDSWDGNWTYVMISDPSRTFESLWKEKGYIDTIPAKFEDFTLVSGPPQSRICIFIDPKAFDHPVNRAREYLNAARDRGQKRACEFTIPERIAGEVDGLAPVVLRNGQKLFVATVDFGPCEHAWSNLHPDNSRLAVVNENSAVPLDLVIAKPPVDPKYSKGLIPAKGSADMTTDYFYRGKEVFRKPILQGLFKG